MNCLLQVALQDVELGKGGFGEVVLGRFRGTDAAVKKMCVRDQEEAVGFLEEVQAHVETAQLQGVVSLLSAALL